MHGWQDREGGAGERDEIGAAPARPAVAVAWGLLAFVVGAILSVLAGIWHQRTLAEERSQDLVRSAERAIDGIRLELELAGRLVRSVQAVFLASEAVGQDEFERLLRGIEADGGFPSLQALAFAAREEAGDGRTRYVTRMIAPVRGNERILGLDIATQPANLQALEQSLLIDRPVMSAPFRLVQFSDAERRGMTIRLPVFSAGEPPVTPEQRQARMLGSLAASFDLDGLLSSAVASELRTVFRIRVLDITDGGSGVLLHDFRPDAGDRSAGVAVTEDVEYGSRRWRVELVAVPWDGVLYGFPLLTIAIGLLGSVLLALLIWSLVGTRARAQSLAQRMTARYQASEARFRTLNERLPVLVALARADDGRIEYLNAAGRRRLGVDPDRGIGIGLEAMLADSELRARVLAVAAGAPALVEEAAHIGPGRGFWASLSVARVALDGADRLLIVASDVTELRELAERLRHQASHDELTGLLNRRGFEQALDDAIALVDAGGAPRALLYMDLDQFKVVNESVGHAAGDALLVHLAGRLQRCLMPGDRLARLGGDEFGVLLADGREEVARIAAERIRQAVAEIVWSHEDRSYPVSASLGLVLLDQPGRRRQELMSLADTVCFLAKEGGRNRLRIYRADDLESVGRRTALDAVGRVRQAMADGRLELHYQELVRVRSGREGEGPHIELLLRMRDPDGRQVAPVDFIPAAERFGLMPQLDRWVIEAALSNFERLHPQGQSLARCAINLSGATVDDEGFADFLLAAIARHGVPARKLCFEITETTAVGNMPRLLAMMQRLRAAGCCFALDDFGTGTASFGFLRQLAVDAVKIDGSFISRIDRDPMSLSIVRAIVEIGHQAGLDVVAEWVDSEAILERVRALGVDWAQGYHLHRPEPAVFCR